jgi:hypothetical protein
MPTHQRLTLLLLPKQPQDANKAAKVKASAGHVVSDGQGQQLHYAPLPSSRTSTSGDSTKCKAAAELRYKQACC